MHITWVCGGGEGGIRCYPATPKRVYKYRDSNKHGKRVSILKDGQQLMGWAVGVAVKEWSSSLRLRQQIVR